MSSLSVLASLSSMYKTPHPVVDASEFICCIYISLLPSLCQLSNLGMWHICDISEAYLLLAHIPIAW